MSSAKFLNALFPEPSKYPVSRQSPSKLPGVTVESTQTLLRLFRHNKEHHHIFFNDIEFHKCVRDIRIFHYLIFVLAMQLITS
jgi:hypothetical protein